MNPYDCRIELRDRSIFEVFDLSVRLMRAWAGPLARLSAAWLLPWMVLTLTVSWLSGEPIVVFGVLIVLTRVIQAPYMLLATRMLFADPPPTRVVLATMLAELPMVMSAWLASVSQLLISGCLFMFPWVVLYPWTLFMGETLLVEQLPLGEGVRRARYLSRQEPAKAIFGATVILVSGAWVVLAAEALGQSMMSYILQAGAPFGEATNGDVTPFMLLGLLLAQPMIAVFRLLLYVDVRTTLEAWDLHIAFRAAAEEA